MKPTGLHLTLHDLHNLRENDFETWIALAMEDAKDDGNTSLQRTLRKIQKAIETEEGIAERKRLATMNNRQLVEMITR